MRSLEIKARVDDLKRLRNIAANIGAMPGGKNRQVDTYFETHRGILKLRESAMSGSELIAYFRAEGSEPAESYYEHVRVHDPTRLKRVLERAIGIQAVVVKERESYTLGTARIHLDEVEDVGCFIEFAVQLKKSAETQDDNETMTIRELMEVFDVKQEDLVECSYRDLIRHGGGI